VVPTAASAHPFPWEVPPAQRQGLDLSSLSSITMSGGPCPEVPPPSLTGIPSPSPCPESVKQAGLKLFGPALFEMYGASELGTVAIMQASLREPWRYIDYSPKPLAASAHA
jgi:hypothetical protein